MQSIPSVFNRIKSDLRNRCGWVHRHSACGKDPLNLRGKIQRHDYSLYEALSRRLNCSVPKGLEALTVVQVSEFRLN